MANKTITDTNFNFPNQKSFYKGKVREVYNINDELLVMVATDRLSAFDVVMPKGIPFKGQILNEIATKMMKATEDLVPNWLIATPDPNVAVGYLCRSEDGTRLNSSHVVISYAVFCLKKKKQKQKTTFRGSRF